MMNSLPLFLFIWIFLVSFCHSFVFVTGKATDFKRDNNKFTKHDEEKRLFAQTISKSALQPDILAGAAAAVPVVTNSASVVFAKFLGYVMAAGSMAVYTPILINLLKAKSDKGLSTQTWIMNILGISLACVYPFQKGFPLSTYVELVVLTVQSLIILGVICHYKHIEKEFLFSMIPFALYLFAVTRYSIPPTVLNFVQLASTLICNYANVPQILLGFREKRTGWSPITSGLSLAGNIIRVFTTLQLTKGDPLFLFGYILGAVFNSVLLWQTFIYRKK